MSRLRDKAGQAALREHLLLVVISALIAVSVALSNFAPVVDRQVEIDSQREVNELVCIPWLSRSFPVNRGLWVGLSNAELETTATLRLPETTVPLGSGDVLSLEAGREPQRISVEGPAARHLSTAIWASTDQGLANGAAMDDCRAPGQSWWFGGLDTTAGSSATLVLANPDNEDVVVNLLGYTQSGPADAGERRILVRAESRAAVDLNLAFPAQPSLAIQVGLKEGRVAASVQAWSVKADAARGRSFIDPMLSPVKSGAIVGVRDQSPRSMLQLLAPDEDATVTVRLSTRGGSSALAGVDKLLLTSGEVVSIPLAPMLSDIATTLVVESSHPIVAAVRQISDRGGSKDLDIQMLQPVIRKKASAAIADVKLSHELVAYSERGASVTYQVLADGKLVFGGTLEVNPTTSALLEFENELPRGSVLLVETDDEVSITLWVYRGSGQSSSHPLREEAATVVAGASLLLTTS